MEGRALTWAPVLATERQCTLDRTRGAWVADIHEMEECRLSEDFDYQDECVDDEQEEEDDLVNDLPRYRPIC